MRLNGPTLFSYVQVEAALSSVASRHVTGAGPACVKRWYFGQVLGHQRSGDGGMLRRSMDEHSDVVEVTQPSSSMPFLITHLHNSLGLGS